MSSGKSGRHKTSVEKYLSSCGLILSSSPKDGNCFFYSVATDILQAPGTWKSVLKELGVIQCISDTIPEDLQQRLRQVFVSELMGDRQHYYTDFVTGEVNYCSEATKFLLL